MPASRDWRHGRGCGDWYPSWRRGVARWRRGRGASLVGACCRCEGRYWCGVQRLLASAAHGRLFAGRWDSVLWGLRGCVDSRHGRGCGDLRRSWRRVCARSRGGRRGASRVGACCICDARSLCAVQRPLARGITLSVWWMLRVHARLGNATLPDLHRSLRRGGARSLVGGCWCEGRSLCAVPRPLARGTTRSVWWMSRVHARRVGNATLPEQWLIASGNAGACSWRARARPFRRALRESASAAMPVACPVFARPLGNCTVSARRCRLLGDIRSGSNQPHWYIVARRQCGWRANQHFRFEIVKGLPGSSELVRV